MEIKAHLGSPNLAELAAELLWPQHKSYRVEDNSHVLWTKGKKMKSAETTFQTTCSPFS